MLGKGTKIAGIGYKLKRKAPNQIGGISCKPNFTATKLNPYARITSMIKQASLRGKCIVIILSSLSIFNFIKALEKIKPHKNLWGLLLSSLRLFLHKNYIY